MKKIFRILSVLALCVPGIPFTASQAQVNTLYNTPQAPNFDFEVWDNPEPWGWNSSSCFEAGHGASKENRVQSVWQYNEVRPGSSGVSSVRIKVTKSTWRRFLSMLPPWYKDEEEEMGTLTTGTLYYYDEKTNESSCIYTNTGDNSKRWAFTGRPDSIVFWAKSGVNGGRNSDMTLYLHNNAKLEDRNPNGTAVGTVIGSANLKIPAGGQWKRYSAPIRYESDETPAYLLLSFTAGNNFREVVEGDELFIDDVLLVYNPVLSIDTTTSLQMVHHGREGITFEVPYTFYSGTQAPLNAAAQNELRVYLSDEHGSFDNPRLLGTQQLNGGDNIRHQGRIRVALPANTPDSDKYRLRIEASNYPLQSNIINLNIYSQWYLTIRQADRYGTTNALDKTLFRNGISYTATATPNTACAFLHWIENGTVIGAPAEYEFIIDKDRELVAEFDTTYTLIMAESVGADGYFANNNAKKITLVHGQIAHVQADIQTGYFFRGFEFGGNIWQSQKPDDAYYDYMVQQGGTIRVLTDSIPYDFEFSAWPAAKLGTVTGSGIYKHFSTVRAQAQEVNEYSRFLHWIDEEENVVGNEPELELTGISHGGKYRAVFEEEFHKVSLSVNDPRRGFALQCAQPKADSSYSAFDFTHIYIRAVPQRGMGFRRWEVARNGISQSEILENPYDVTNNTHLDADYAFRAIFDTLRYTLTLNSEHGTVEGAGIYMYGKSAWLLAFPYEGYHFRHWESASGVLGTKDSLYFTIYSDSTVTAVYDTNEYPIRILSNDDRFGTVDKPSGNYKHFTRLELNAVPDADAELRYWVVDGDTLSTANQYILNVDGTQHEVLAVFSYKRSKVDLIVSNPTYGYANGAGIYERNTPVRLYAESFDGYDFIGWQTPQGDMLPPETIDIEAISGDTTLKVLFVAQALTVTLKTSGNGSVSITDGTLAGDVVNRTVGYMNYVEISASPDPAYEFEGWYDTLGNRVSTFAHEGFTVSKDTVLEGRFIPLRYAVNLFMSPLGACRLIGAGRYNDGSPVTISAEILGDYEFNGWYENDAKVESNITFTIPSLTSDRYFTASFREKRVAVHFNAEPAEYADECLGMGEYKYAYNANLQVVPKTGYEVYAWVNKQGDTLSRVNPYLYEIRSHDTLTALMRSTKLNPSFAIEPDDAGRVRCGDVFYNVDARATAEPAYGYAFSHWKNESGEVVSYDAVLSFKTKSDTIFTAVFDSLSYEIKGRPRKPERGEVTGVGTYKYLSTCVLGVTNDPHYHFAGWYDPNGTMLSRQRNWTFTVTGPVDATAYFEPLPVLTHLAVEPSNGGTIQYSSGQYNGGQMLGEVKVLFEDSITITAVPAEGMVFNRWRREDSTGTVDEWKDESHTFVPLGGRFVTAFFDTAVHSVSLTVEPENAGTVSGEGEYKHFTFAPLKAHAAENYHFSAYKVGDKVISYDSAFSLAVDSSMKITAVFTPKDYMVKVYPSDKNKGQAIGTGSYGYGSMAAVEAFVWNDSLAFSHWSLSSDGSDILSSEAAWQYEVNGNTTLYAFFKQTERTIELNSVGHGSVRGDGTYAFGQEVVISAEAEDGYHFVAWQEYGLNVTEEPNHRVQVNGNRCFTAVFEPDTFHLALQYAEAVHPAGVLVYGAGDYANGTVVNVWISGAPLDYRFVAWQDADGNTVSENPEYTFPISSDTVLYAAWEPTSLSLQLQTEGFGQVSGAGNYAYGEQASVKAVPDTGYRFVAWYRGQDVFSNRDSLHIPMFSNLSLTARFEADVRQVKPIVNISEGGGIEVSVTLNTATLLAKPNAHYRFVHWSIGDSIVGLQNRMEVPVEKASDMVAHFEPDRYRIEISTNMPEGLSVLHGSGTFTYAQTATVQLSLQEGYVFEGWFEEGSQTALSTSVKYEFNVERAMRIVAVVRKNSKN